MTRRRAGPRGAVALLLALAPGLAQASLLSGDALDMAANAISWVVIIFVPLAAIGLFLYVHVLPEVIAERQHHPQKQSIKVLCILSLFFGGLLWPLAWLWAYTKPIGYRAAYGTEKHDDHYLAIGERLRLGAVDAKELAQARAELAAMQAKGALSPQLRALIADIDSQTALPARETA